MLDAASERSPVDSRSSGSPALRGRLDLNLPGLFPFRLSRLFDHELSALLHWLQPIEESNYYFFRPPRNLARTFSAAERLFGRTSQRFDDHKCSFSFPLLMTARRGDCELRYVMKVFDLRGVVNVPLARVQEEPPPALRGYRAPVERELSRRDIDGITDVLLDVLHDVGDRRTPPDGPFYRTVPAQCIVYGFHGGSWFQEELEDQDAYDRRVAELAVELDPIQLQRERQHVDGLLADVDGR